MVEHGAVELRAEPLTAVFLPSQGMLGASLRIRGEEVLGLVGDIGARAAAGQTCGIPLLYPWANRLAEHGYRALGAEVRLDSPLLGHDDAGLPNHGVPWSRLVWQVRQLQERSVLAELDWTSPELLRVYPFPHHVELRAVLDPRGLSLLTAVRADAGSDVPISFGFHPFFELPGVPRSQWQVQLPAMRRLLTDSSLIPDGRTVESPPYDGPLGRRTYDNGYELLRQGAVFRVQGGRRSLAVRFGAGYTHAQLFAPPGTDFMAIEPMTAAANALRSGRGLRVVRAGGSFTAEFTIEVR